MSKGNFLKLLSLIIVFLFSISVFSQEKTEAENLYEKGVQLVKDRNYEEALKILRQAIKLAPEQAAIHNAMGLASLGQEKFGEAIENFRKALRLLSETGKDRLGVHRNLCVALVFDKKTAEAVLECQQAVRLEPELAANYAQLALAWRANGQIDEGIRIAENALQKFPDNEDLLYFLGSSYALKSDFAKELETLEKLVKLKPKTSSYRVMLSESYLRFDRVEEAAETARKAIELDVLNPFAYYRLAKIYDEIGMSEEVISTLQKAVELKPDAGEIYYLYGKNLAKLGNEAQAIVNLREAVRLMPDSALANYELGKKLVEASRFSEAVEPLRRANELKPNDLDNKTALGTALLESGNYDEALRYLAEADRLRPANSIIQMLIEVSKGRKQGVAEIEKVKQRVAGNPRDIAAKKSLALLYQFTGKIDEAERLFIEAFNLTAETAESNNELAVFYHDTRRFDLAAKLLRRAIELKQHHVLYLSLASNLKKLGRTAEALEAFRKALEIKPDSVHVLKMYADALREAGKRREAIEMYQKVLQVEPRNAPALFNLSVLHLKLLDRDNASRYYETWRSIEPNLAKNLGWIFRLIK